MTFFMKQESSSSRIAYSTPENTAPRAQGNIVQRFYAYAHDTACAYTHACVSNVAGLDGPGSL